MKLTTKNLVGASYKDGVLDATIVERIASRLSRKVLKKYIHGLREQEKRSTVIVETAHGKTTELEELQHVFAGKKIETRENPELLLGLRITDNDDVYNMNLKNSLERIAAYAAE